MTGSAPPKISNIRHKLSMSSESPGIFRKCHLTADVEYEGCGKLALQAETFLGKHIYLAVKVVRLQGTAIFILNREPQTHWGFCFETEPEVVLSVVSSLQQRSLPKLTRVITSVIKRTIRRKHTKPNYKKRYAPLFPEPSVPINQQILLCQQPLNSGKLLVKVVSANRVISGQRHLASNALQYYCTIGLGCEPWNAECCPLRQISAFDTVIENVGAAGIGLQFSETEGLDGRSQLVIEDIHKNSPAADTPLKQGDVVTAINDKRVVSFKSALSASLSTNRARLSVRRPLLKWNGIFTTGDVSQDQLPESQKAGGVFVEEEEFMVLLEEEEEKGVDPGGEGCLNEGEVFLRTGPCGATVSPYWDDTFLLSLQEDSQYLTVCLWASDERKGNPILIGFANIELGDIALQCIATTSNMYNDSVTLALPVHLKWQESATGPLPSLPTQLPKMDTIAGEVKMQFLLCIDPGDEVPSCEHSFHPAQIQESEVCGGCGKAFPHNTCRACIYCGEARHEGCLAAGGGKHPRRRHTGGMKKPTVSHRQRSQTTSTSPSGRLSSFLKDRRWNREGAGGRIRKRMWTLGGGGETL